MSTHFKCCGNLKTLGHAEWCQSVASPGARATPPTEKTMIENQPNCAHRHIEYRTEQYEHDFGPRREGPSDPTSIHVTPFGVHTLTRGWWACRDCATTFEPVVGARATPPTEIRTEATVWHWPDGQIRQEAPYRCGTFMTSKPYAQCLKLSDHSGPHVFGESAARATPEDGAPREKNAKLRRAMAQLGAQIALGQGVMYTDPSRITVSIDNLKILLAALDDDQGETTDGK